MLSYESRFAGSILGLAIGDALGYPSEFRSRKQILSNFPPHGLTDFVAVHDPRWIGGPYILGTQHPPGTYTDDTQMTISVAHALLKAGHLPLDALMECLAQEFVAWSQSPDNNRAPGNTCMSACQNLVEGINWRHAGISQSKGCGSAMRVAPIGLCFWRDHKHLLEVARSSSIITHGHDAAIEGAAAAALLVALALEDYTPEQMYEALCAECAPFSEDFNLCLQKLPQFISQPPEIALSRYGLGESWVAEEAVVSALYCFWRHPRDFRAAILTAVNTDGDSDSIACIVGSIAGAALGLEAIPLPWRNEIENSPYLHQIAQQLYKFALTL
jgi:ADP-ribosylglycohydrolase